MAERDDQDLMSAAEVISAWTRNMAQRSVTSEFDREGYEARRHLYDEPPTLDQYQALFAYLDTMDLGTWRYASDAERDAAYLGTFGKAFPESGPDELQMILDDHMKAMAAAYDIEMDNALGGMRP